MGSQGTRKRSKEEIIEGIGRMSAEETTELMKDLAAKFSSLIDPSEVAAMLQRPTPAPSPLVAPAKTTEVAHVAKYNVFLIRIGEKKIAVSKAVFNLNKDLGLRGAVEIVNEVQSGRKQLLAEGVDSDRAHEIIGEFEALGAGAMMVETAIANTEKVSVYLSKVPAGDNFMESVRAIEEHCGLSFTKAHDLFMALIFSKYERVADYIPREKAEAMKGKLEAAGFGVEIT